MIYSLAGQIHTDNHGLCSFPRRQLKCTATVTEVIEEREHIIYYRQENAERAVDMAGGRVPDSATSLETRPYLVVKAWRGSGNATVVLAPWLRAHDEEMNEVVEPSAECRIVIAVKLAHEYVREETGRTRDVPATGQADLGAWSP